MPAIPAELIEQLNRYQNTRGADVRRLDPTTAAC